MSNESTFDGIRLAYVHLSVTTPRPSGGRGVATGVVPASRDTGHRLWGRAAHPRPTGRPIGLAA